MELIQYIRSSPLQTFAKNATIVQPGDKATTIYAIRDGFVKVNSLDDSGRQKLLWIAGRYDLIPLEKLFSSGNVNYFYTAFSETSMYSLKKDEFLKRAYADPKMMAQIAKGLSEHHDDLLGRMNAMEQSDIRSKILLVLQNLCDKFDASAIVHLHEIGLNLTHQDLADMIGATRESVSLELKRMQDADLVSYSRSQFTVNLDAITAELSK